MAGGEGAAGFGVKCAGDFTSGRRSAGLGGQRESDILKSQEWCRESARRVARSFFRGMSLTPADRRPAIFAVYAWMRRADDLADELARDEALIALANMRHRTKAVMNGKELTNKEIADEPFWPAFVDAVHRFHVRGEWLGEMLDGLEGDARSVAGEARFANDADLDLYRHQVGGVVGQVCTAVWGVRDHSMQAEAMMLADYRGRAIQLLNIVRDIGDDWRTGRVYIPVSVLGSFGFTPAALVEWPGPWEPSGPGPALVRSLIRRAQRELSQTWRYERLLSPDCARAAWTLRASYEAIASVLQRTPSRAVRGRRARPGVLGKSLLLARAFAGRPWKARA